MIAANMTMAASIVVVSGFVPFLGWSGASAINVATSLLSVISLNWLISFFSVRRNNCVVRT